VVYLLLIIGALLVSIFAPLVFKQAMTARTVSPLPPGEEGNLEDGLPEIKSPVRQRQLEEQITDLQEKLAALSARINTGSNIFQANPGENGQGFHSYLQAVLSTGQGPNNESPAKEGAPGKLKSRAPAARVLSGRISRPNLKESGEAETVTVRDKPLSIQEQISQAHAGGESVDSLARRFGRGKGEITLILDLHRLRKT